MFNASSQNLEAKWSIKLLMKEEVAQPVDAQAL